MSCRRSVGGPLGRPPRLNLTKLYGFGRVWPGATCYLLGTMGLRIVNRPFNCRGRHVSPCDVSPPGNGSFRVRIAPNDDVWNGHLGTTRRRAEAPPSADSLRSSASSSRRGRSRTYRAVAESWCGRSHGFICISIELGFIDTDAHVERMAILHAGAGVGPRTTECRLDEDVKE